MTPDEARDDLAQRIVDYLRTRITPWDRFDEVEEAVRQALYIALVEARPRTLVALGGVLMEPDAWGKVAPYTQKRVPVWIVPDE